MIPTGYGQLSLVHSGDNFEGDCINTFGFINPGDEDAAACGDIFKGALLGSGLLAQYSGSVTVTEVRIKLGPDATGESAEVAIGNSGLVGGQAVSPQVALLVRKNTALGGRAGRGRFYIPGMPAASLVNSGTFDGTDMDQVVSEWTDIWNVMAFVGLEQRLLHDSPLTPTPVTSMVGSVRVATQRRRARR